MVTLCDMNVTPVMGFLYLYFIIVFAKSVLQSDNFIMFKEIYVHDKKNSLIQKCTCLMNRNVVFM